MSHTIFFDSSCRLCQNTVTRIKEMDVKKIFQFFPLNSQLAKEKLSEELQKGDTIVLMENEEKIWIRSKAVFRILKLLDGKWAWLGFLVHVPGLDMFYRAIAHNRKLFD